tara:strand:+ start:4018 stop:5001 length:984 start_codon:yes stop_codon:yes gene_type:complete
MILKYFNLNENTLKHHNFFLLYGNNEGLKNEIETKIVNKNQTLTYDEKDILLNQDEFFENTLTKSLFETTKTITIKRVSDKILNIFEKIFNKDYKDLIIILNAGALDKRSKLRSFFEKEKRLICMPFYPDNEQTLSKLSYNYLREKNISISSSDINTIVSKCNGDRENLFNELKKIENYAWNGKKLNAENISKLTNIIENHSVSELIDSCLNNNKKKIFNILNENNFTNEDCIVIIRTLLNKAKRILALSSIYKDNGNIDLTISLAKPPIFWKDKETIKQQIFKWSPDRIRELIYKITELELLVKKNINNSVNLITDFIIFQTAQIN